MSIKKQVSIIVALSVAVIVYFFWLAKDTPINYFLGVSRKDWVKKEVPVFHIKAKYWYDCRWQILFTNDNFRSEANLMKCWDASSKYRGNEIIHQLMIFKNEYEAVSFAKRFKSFQSCKRWNDSVANEASKLAEFRNAHPIEIVDEPDMQSCKNEEGKEIIVN